MNAIELFVLVGFVACGFLIGRLLGTHFGVLGWIGGVALGVAVWGLVWWGVAVLTDKISKHRPPRPPCRRGRCSASDYQFKRMIGDDVELMCSCGDKYIVSENRFMDRR
jgi:hypothetical protein